MADTLDIFISYKREERDMAAALAQTLRDLGFSVYYDISLAHGTSFADQLDTQLRAARLGLVLWSEAAALSDWVKSEARFAKERGIYHPVLIGRPDLPLDLRGDHAVNLPDGYHPKLIVDSVFARLGDPTGQDRGALERSLIGFRRQMANERGTPGSDRIAQRIAQMTAIMFPGEMAQRHDVMPSEILDWTGRTEVDDARLAQHKNISFYRRILLSRTPLSDISPLSAMEALEEVFLDDTRVSDISALADKRFLTGLHLANTSVSDLRPLMRCRNLEWLNLRGTPVADLTPLVGLPKLGGLMLPDKTKIGDMIHAEAAHNIEAVQDFLRTV